MGSIPESDRPRERDERAMPEGQPAVFGRLGSSGTMGFEKYVDSYIY